MWDFEHPPWNAELTHRYDIQWMLPSQCADELASGTADIGLVPIAALATTPGLRILPGCTIASKAAVRSLLLVCRANRPLTDLRSVAADTASRTTIAYTRILFHKWGNPSVPFIPMIADLDVMLDRADDLPVGLHGVRRGSRAPTRRAEGQRQLAEALRDAVQQHRR